MAPRAPPCPPGPCRYPSGVRARTQLRHGSPGTSPVHLPRRTSPPILQMRGQRKAQRGRMTHPRSHTQEAIQAGYTPTSLRVFCRPQRVFIQPLLPQPLVVHVSRVITCIPLTGCGPAEEEGGPAHVVGVLAAAGIHGTCQAHSRGYFLGRLVTPVHRHMVMSSQPWSSTCLERGWSGVDWEVGWGGQETSL